MQIQSTRSYAVGLSFWQVILSVPESLALTQIDAEKQELVGEVAAASSELIALTLWLMAERSKGISSAYSKFLAMLPVRVQTAHAVACGTLG